MGNKPIIILFKENELNISELYSLYAKNIPEKKEFWNDLADAEISHAKYISDNITSDNENSIVEKDFSREIIKYLKSFILKEINRAKNKKTLHQDALLIALRVEKSMIEKKCFSMFAPTDTAIKKVFRKLNKETEEHVNVITEELKKTGGSIPNDK